MSYAARSYPSLNFSSLSASSITVQGRNASSAATTFGRGAGTGARIPASTFQSLGNSFGSNGQEDNGYFSISVDRKETVKGLNDRLATYLTRVRSLEESNNTLEEKIKEFLLKKGAGEPRDWDSYEKSLTNLRQQVTDMISDNARLLLQLDNTRLATADFKLKFENEKSICQTVEQDVVGLRKILDNTHFNHMQLESHVKSMGEELESIKKNHEEEMADMRAQVKKSSVSVTMDNAKGVDLSETIDNIRAQYEKDAQKKLEEIKTWYKNKFDTITTEVSQSTEALQTDQREVKELRRRKQALEIDLQALRSMNDSLEGTLNDTGSRYDRHISAINCQLLQLEAELTRARAQLEKNAAEYGDLLSLKMKLEGEIATYSNLLGGGGVDNGVRVEGGDGGRRDGVKGDDARDIGGYGDDRGMNNWAKGMDAGTKDFNAGAKGLDSGAKGLDSGAKGLDLGAKDFAGAKGMDTGESVEFSLEQALWAAPPPESRKKVLVIHKEVSEDISHKEITPELLEELPSSEKDLEKVVEEKFVQAVPVEIPPLEQVEENGVQVRNNMSDEALENPAEERGVEEEVAKVEQTVTEGGLEKPAQGKEDEEVEDVEIVSGVEDGDIVSGVAQTELWVEVQEEEEEEVKPTKNTPEVVHEIQAKDEDMDSNNELTDFQTEEEEGTSNTSENPSQNDPEDDE